MIINIRLMLNNVVIICPLLFLIIRSMTTCEILNCYNNHSCCDYLDGKPYCLVSSQCDNLPIWQAAAIPAVMFTLAVILIIIACCKLCWKHKQPMQVSNFARQQIGMYPRQSQARLQTLTSINMN